VKGDPTFNERGAAPADTYTKVTNAHITRVQHKTDILMAHRENERHSKRSVKHKNLRLLRAATKLGKLKAQKANPFETHHKK